MKFSAAFLLVCSCLLLTAAPRRAHAEQFVLLDLTYEATSANTSDSHFPAKPADGIPQNLRSPIDYASGTAYVRFEVLSKPSAVKTLYNICFENSAASCMGYPPAYSGTGVNNFSGQFSSFWNYMAVDWTKGITKVSLILKKEDGTKVQGDPQFYPYKMHVTITLVSPGGTYVPPDSTGMNPDMAGRSGGSGTGGSGGSGGSRAGAGGAGNGGNGGAAGMSSGAAGRASAGRSGGAGAGSGGAGSSAPVVDASTPPDPETPVADAAADEPDQPTKQPPRQLDPQANAVDKRAPPPGDLEAGCSVGSNHSQAQLGLFCLAAISFIARKRRSRGAAPATR
ncbi:MAG TPA: hypothetical protein VJV78_23295 [Polyangiales bacterium]|nr:hypothetical protein [Polyangiales bacterium]